MQQQDSCHWQDGMRIHFQFRRYELPFRAPVRNAHSLWSEREGVVVRLQDMSEGGTAGVGWGEAAPIPWFGTETVDDVVEGCRAIGPWVESAALDAVPLNLGCLRHALGEAQREIAPDQVGAASKPGAPGETASLGVAALLPAGRAALPLIPVQAEIGFRVFKWKVGVGDPNDELVLLDDVCAALPAGGKLRLDANGAWDRRRAERWLERCADRPVEHVEQPCLASASASTTERRRVEDVLLGLAGDYPTAIALDESLAADGDFERWIDAGWPGVFVVKPSLLADPRAVLARLEKGKARVVFSSALETAVGARTALRVAFAWKGEPRALGFGVWPLFADARFDGPHTGPFLRKEDVERINPEHLWNALS
jgi:O-succinylbenzoate synthase